MHLKVAFRTSDDRRVRGFDFARLDKGCDTPVKLFDLHAAAAGDVTARFSDYSEAANRKLVEKSAKSIEAEPPPGAVEALIHYPSQLECTR